MLIIPSYTIHFQEDVSDNCFDFPSERREWQACSHQICLSLFGARQNIVGIREAHGQARRTGYSFLGEKDCTAGGRREYSVPAAN